eukprot:1362133-Rhodomonas_salina.2
MNARIAAINGSTAAINGGSPDLRGGFADRADHVPLRENRVESEPARARRALAHVIQRPQPVPLALRGLTDSRRAH